MKNLVKDIITLNMEEINSYHFPLDEVFGLEVINNGIKFCFIIKFSSNIKKLICCGSGAHERNEITSSGRLIKPPFFDNWSWYTFFDESFIAYSDPIFFHDDDIKLGWFVGDRNEWYLEIVSDIIIKLSKNQNISQNNILFYGSSGGGFSSICLGTLIKGSKVIVNNSQFFVMNFADEYINALFKILYKEFPDLSKSEIIDKIDYRLDVTELFKKYDYVPQIYYYINVESDDDLYNQCIPLIKKLKRLYFYTDNLSLFFYKELNDKSNFSLPEEVSVKIIKSFSQNYLYNNEIHVNYLINNLNNNNAQLNNQILELNGKLNSFGEVNNMEDFKQNLHKSKEKKLEQMELDLLEKEKLIIDEQSNLNKRDKHITEKEKFVVLKEKQLAEKEKQLNDLFINLMFIQYGNNDKNIIFSEIADFWNIIVYDNATLSKYDDESYVLPRGNLKRTVDGTILTGNWGDLFFSPTRNQFYYNIPIVLELTIVDLNDVSNIRFQLYSQKQKLNRTFDFDDLNIKKNDNIKIVYDGTVINIYVGQELKKSQNATFKEKFRIGVQTFSDNAYFKYKNMKIYKI